MDDWTARAPEAVFTVRTYAIPEAYDPTLSAHIQAIVDTNALVTASQRSRGRRLA